MGEPSVCAFCGKSELDEAWGFHLYMGLEVCNACLNEPHTAEETREAQARAPYWKGDSAEERE